MTLRTLTLRIVAGVSLLVLALVAGCSDLGAPLRLVPQLQLEETAVDFGTVAITDSVTRTVIIRNSGTGNLDGDASVSCEGFRLIDGAGRYSIPPEGAHPMTVRFKPPGIGTFTCELVLGPGMPTIALSGGGASQPAGAACRVSSPGLDFGSLAVGQTKLAIFKIFSTGTAPVNLDVLAGCSVYTIVAGGGARALSPGDSLAVAVQFAPTSGGPQTCTIATGAGCPSVTLTGSATTVSFRTDLVPILNAQSCTACHGWTRASELVNVDSFVYGAPLIKPFDPNGSVLYAKIANLRTFGGAMPQGTNGLPAAQRKKFFDWINEGALDN